MDAKAIAKAIIIGEDPSPDDVEAYWAQTDAGDRPREETLAVMAALAGRKPERGAVLGFVRYIARSYPPVPLPSGSEAVNIVGTGGGPSTFNISTATTFVAAAAGAKVLKSGSGAYSSSVGSSDVLAGLGLAGALSDDLIDRMLGEVGVAFSPVSRYAPICRRLAMACMPMDFKTVGRFINRLGPLIGPHKVGASIIGAASPVLFDTMRYGAEAAGKRALVVMSDSGVDEFLALGVNRCVRTDTGKTWIEPGSYLEGESDPWQDLAGGDLEFNVTKLKAVISGEAPSLAIDTVAMNAGAVLMMAGQADSISEGQTKAWTAILSGAAFATLQNAVRFVEEHAPANVIRRKREVAA